MVLLRFAPSPTGGLHLGGLRTALYNYLYAKKLAGKWILRIEDTDASRYVPGAVDGIRSALAWAGLQYDYGPGRDNTYAPYYQSERLDLYHSYANKLLDSGHAYRCFCSSDKLSTTRERLARSGSNATYDKTCLHLTDEEVARRVRAGEPSIVRLKDDNLPSRPTPPDLIFGQLKDSHASLPTDPILLKSDLFPTYHLASVADDHEMGITHVLRGEEWLPSLPLHLDLYAALSLTPPKFAHLPILLNPDRSKMSKRKGDVQVAEYMRRGWEPEAVVNWLALAGWGVHHEHEPEHGTPRPHQQAPDSTTLITIPELISQFDLSALTHRRMILDPSKLEFLNKHHLMRTWSSPEGLESLAHRAQHAVKDAFPTSPHTTIAYLKDVIRTLQGRITVIQDVPALAPYLFAEPDLAAEEARAMRRSVAADDYARVLRAVRGRVEREAGPWGQLDVAKVLREENRSVGIPSKVFMTVLRHALSGMKTGPSVPEIMHLLGRERSLRRLTATDANTIA